MWRLYNEFKLCLRPRLAVLYGEDAVDRLLERISLIASRYNYLERRCSLDEPCWNEQSCLLITYGDMVHLEDEAPLATLNRFLCDHLAGVITGVHILPFYPYSSDDGFAVIDYRQVDPALGTWEHIEELFQNFRLMFDLVINHVSSRSRWFQEYIGNIAPARDYFIQVEPGTDLTAVVRPRTSPLLTPAQTVCGERLVWTTFSPDQVDLNFANPDVLLEILDVFLGYVNQGAGIIRLDAIAYLWKEIGTDCINLPQTHEVVKLLRGVIDHITPGTLLLTETNLPHAENISYFGDGDEAHMVYQFSLPPLLLHAIQTGSGRHLKRWARDLAPPPPGCTFFNFTASHDGIGVRPLEGLLEADEVASLAKTISGCGGLISSRTDAKGKESIYELNITWFDAMKDPTRPDDLAWQIHRFLCTQTVMLSLRGVPAFYFHSLTASENNLSGVAQTGMARTINRGRWPDQELRAFLADPSTSTARVFAALKDLVRKRAGQEAFHPDVRQQVLDGPDALFILRRQPEKAPAVTCVHNLSGQSVTLALASLQAKSMKQGAWDIIAEEEVGQNLTLEPYQCRWLVGG